MVEEYFTRTNLFRLQSDTEYISFLPVPRTGNKVVLTGYEAPSDIPFFGSALQTRTNRKNKALNKALLSGFELYP